MKKIHGGDLESYYEEFGNKEPIDFSANISPLGIPQAIIDELQKEILSIAHYPDPFCRKLTSKLSEYHNLNSDFILCGNGAADLIYRFVFAIKPKKALLLAPTFAEYEEALDCQACEISYYYLQESNNFVLTDDILEYMTNDIDVIFLCQPNNPTGQIIDIELLEKIIQKADEERILLALDECFVDFLMDEISLINHVGQYKNLLIFKAFTKMYALAGIRLGYCITSNLELLELMKKFSQPWAVSTLAQKAGEIALMQTDYVKKVKDIVCCERKFLQDELTKLGFKVYPSYANFVLFFTDYYEFVKQTKENGILVRDCSNYKGLGKGFYRVAVRNRWENEILIEVFRGIRNNSNIGHFDD